jgi:CDP-paratose 2-epimerase
VKEILITGSSGLIGSEAVQFYDGKGYSVVGIDSNMRQVFFGPKGDTSWNLERLKKGARKFTHYDVDIRDRGRLFDLFRDHDFDMVIHCAAQPSHDKAGEIPLLDFEVNALGTVNLLEATRQFCPEAIFIHMSTNKVYGDAPNELPLIETETRYDYARKEDYHGVSEECRIDRCLHSLFGASKTAGDVIAQEYGRYFGMKVGIFRGGCLTGPMHSGVELHGFLSYLVHVAVTGKPYTIYGYKGKQVRDQIHSHDVIMAFEAFANEPHPGEVYNLGGGRANAASVVECIQLIKEIGGYKVDWTYQDHHRLGDHICYVSDLRKLRKHYALWRITRSLPSIVKEMIHAEEERVILRKS